MLGRYVLADLVRNPRRTLSTMLGVTLGVGLSCAVLFFVDGLSASMTQRAVAPLPVDMQRVLTDAIGEDIVLTQRLDHDGVINSGETVQIVLELRNVGTLPANEVNVRSLPPDGLTYVEGSAVIDEVPVDQAQENPFAHGPARVGYNLGTLPAGATVAISYSATATLPVDTAVTPMRSSFSTREGLTPTAANAPAPMALVDLATAIAAVPGVAFAEPLSFADLPSGSLSSGGSSLQGAMRVFGFDASYAQRNASIKLVDGSQRAGEALVSAEAAAELNIQVGDLVTVALPDGSQLDVNVSGIVDLTRASSLFSSRKGADFETFVYVPNSIVLDSQMFARSVVTAFETALTTVGDRLKSPPINEVEIGVERELLNSEPSAALDETRTIAYNVMTVASGQDYLIDNISNTVAVARDDAAAAKRLFIFLGVPGGLLAGMLAAYAGNVLASGQRREQATLRIRGAGRRHLLWMLTMRVSAITVVGAVVGLVLGYLSAAAVVGHATLTRATTSSLVVSAVLGTVGGLLATGTALYITGRRSIDREINDDRARLSSARPVWSRWYLDVAGLLILGVATIVAVAKSAFNGTPGSVYAGRSVKLPLALLALPIGAWITGCLFAARGFNRALTGRRKRRATTFKRPLVDLARLSIRRRSSAIAAGALVVALIVALATSLSMFTASYDQAKAADSRFVNGSDVRITPSPALGRIYGTGDAQEFAVKGVDSVTPVEFSVHNVVLRSRRTEELSSLAAVDPVAYQRVAPTEGAHFQTGSTASSATLSRLAEDPTAMLLSVDMADFLEAEIDDTIEVLLARGSEQQVTIEMHVVGLFERLPGFPDGVDALISIAQYQAAVPTMTPDFFLAHTTSQTNASLAAVVEAIRTGPGQDGSLLIDTRSTALAKDQSSLAALNIRGLLQLDQGYALAMGAVAIAIFVFGLLLQRRREYVTMRAQGVSPRAIRALIITEAAIVALGGCVAGVVVGAVMARYFVSTLRPLFILTPSLALAIAPTALVVGAVLVATLVTSIVGSSLVNRLRATELLRDE